jgi:hypothetical protein
MRLGFDGVTPVADKPLKTKPHFLYFLYSEFLFHLQQLTEVNKAGTGKEEFVSLHHQELYTLFYCHCQDVIR